MRYLRRLSLIVSVGGLTLISGAQKKPAPQLPAVTPGTQVQAKQPQQVSLERNKLAVRQLFEEMFSNGRYDMQDQVFSRDCKVHFGNSRHLRLEESVAEGKGWRSAAPDLRMNINSITISGDIVHVDWTATGTHTGLGHGLRPSGKKINVRGQSKFRVANGKIVEAWNEEYRPELFRQLGVSKTQAFMFFTTEKVLATLDPIIPDRLYAFLFE
jgi:predicted ester cyclase